MDKAGNITYEEAESDYRKVHKSIIRNENIDCLTLGVYVKIINLSKEWNLNIKGLSTKLSLSDNKVRGCISILEKEGYIARHAVKGEKGKFIGWNYSVYSKPISEKTSAGQRTYQKSDTPLNGQDRNPTTPITDKTESGVENSNIPNLDIDLYIDKNIDKPKKKVAKLNWRGDYKIYKAEVIKAKEELLDDESYKAELTRLYPNIDYFRTITKISLFWESEKGWGYKKKSKSNNINMESTFKNNADKNIVYSNKSNIPLENERMLEMEILNDDGDLGDGTFFKNGARWYYSRKYNKALSINIKATPMPNENWEYDNVKNVWYLPKEEETRTISDMLW